MDAQDHARSATGHRRRRVRSSLTFQWLRPPNDAARITADAPPHRNGHGTIMNQHRECTFISARRSAESPAEAAVPPSLACPGCGSPIQAATPPKPGPGGRYGLLACECAEYPMIAGIPIIMSRLGPQAPLPVRRLCRLVTAGEFGRALTTAAEASVTRPLRGFRTPRRRFSWP